MTKFIYDTKEIMTAAWKRAREAFVDYEGEKTLRQCFKTSLRIVWSHAIVDMNSAISAEKIKAEVVLQKRYKELLSVATENGLSHGKSWLCTSRDALIRNGVPEKWIGMEICYVYND
ncbi:hypothetical protein D0525_16330 [Salmonella enterica]|uniref:hypothetical protein n=1 Tax=Salmonella enterica TaxID=28901 RepID=UPI001012E406|nr:hypothetical protein [Salmonella enterica]EJH7012887.1 hypothetical protein [Salmonella enterica]EJH7438248.1 hypothetical protein [Salmonella enterica]EJH7877542.1 hypothetical protein [Salmonella enterica]EJI6710256.1 hypothetical protein [Salmonella enterica]RXO38237.1 hypothetical protein D0525_16330 [Salmonella enterica]